MLVVVTRPPTTGPAIPKQAASIFCAWVATYGATISQSPGNSRLGLVVGATGSRRRSGEKSASVVLVPPMSPQRSTAGYHVTRPAAGKPVGTGSRVGMGETRATRAGHATGDGGRGAAGAGAMVESAR